MAIDDATIEELLGDKWARLFNILRDAIECGREYGAAEALEEAAILCDGNSLWTNDDCAAAIRALAKEPLK